MCDFPHQSRADPFAANVLRIMREIRAAGIATLDGIASALNARGVRAARVGEWYPASLLKPFNALTPALCLAAITRKLTDDLLEGLPRVKHRHQRARRRKSAALSPCRNAATLALVLDDR